MFDIEQIFAFLKRLLGKKDLLIIFGLLVLYALTRLLNLKELPIFNDEGIYIHWAKVAWHDASWRFVSLTDGKQPLQTWGTIPFLKLFPYDALFAGRLFSVATGLFGLIGMFTLLYYVFNKKTAYIGSLLYIVIPYFLFYDRMAMVDSGVNAFFIWILFFSILLIKTIRLDIALMFGLIAGMGLLAKSSVRVFVGMSLFAPILLEGLFSRSKNAIKKLPSFFFLFAITGFFALIIYNVQRLSPFLHFVEEKNKTFVMTFGEWLQQPFAVFWSNITTVPYYVFAELGWIVVPFGIAGLFLLFKHNKQLALYLSLWLLIPYLGVAFMTKVLFPRYIMFFGSIIVMLAAYCIGQIKNKKIFAVSLMTIVACALFFDYFMWFDYKGIMFPQTDRGQYVEGITVGYGAKEIIEYAREKSKEKEVIILAEGDFGMAGDVLDTFLNPYDKIFIKGYWPLTVDKVIQHQKDLDENKTVYIVTSHMKDVPIDFPAKLIKSYYKPNRESALHLLELLP